MDLALSFIVGWVVLMKVSEIRLNNFKIRKELGLRIISQLKVGSKLFVMELKW